MATNVFFSDLPLIFITNPITGDLTPAINEQAVKKALINLLKTPLGARPFRPDYGTKLYDFLFEPADLQTELAINDEIAEAIKRFEPRVQLIAIESNIQDNGINIKIEYYIVGSPQSQTVELIISRTK